MLNKHLNKISGRLQLWFSNLSFKKASIREPQARDLQITKPFLRNFSTRLRKVGVLATKGLAPQSHILEWKTFWCMDFACLTFVVKVILL